MRFARATLLLVLWPLFSGCGAKEDFEPYDSTTEFENFLRDWDREYHDQFVSDRLVLKALEEAASLEKAREEISRLAKALAEPASTPWPEPLLTWARALPGVKDVEKARPVVAGDFSSMEKRLTAADADWETILGEARKKSLELQKPGFFTFATLADLPADLAWVTNLDAPEVGSPEAKKGGTFHQMMPAFPPSLRVVGNDSNNSFRSEHYDNVEMLPVEMHPDTGEMIPGFADRWAMSPDERTVYYNIDPEARFSDGKPVLTEDILTSYYLHLNTYTNNTYGQQYYREQFSHLTIYSDRIYSVTLKQKKPLAPVLAGNYPAHTGFYSEIGPDFDKRYDWRCRPTVAPYALRPEGIKKGRSITLFRVEDWWAKDKRYRRHRFNADRIEHRVIRDIPKAWEVFRGGGLDIFPLGAPEYWYERSEIPEVFNGYIERHTFYNVWPGSGSGLYLNTARPPLNNKDIRLGLAYALDWDSVIKILLRGDGVRGNSLHEGYVLIKDPPVKARPYDVAKAREHFAAAGFTIPDADGILKNAQGERLSVSVTVIQVATRVATLNLLAEQAKKAGIEIKVDAMEGTGAYQKVGQKLHQIGYNAWGFSPPINDYFQFLHSSNAYEKDGRVKTDTNNLFSYANPEMDRLTEQHRVATSLEEMSRLTAEIEKLMHDEGIFIPGVRINFLREATWRWIRWPEKYATASCYIGFDSYVWWIDEQMREETLRARVENRKFPEVMAMHDHYRNGPPPASGEEPAPPPPQPLPES
jgi:microcin C transport system substrate-binding protein